MSKKWASEAERSRSRRAYQRAWRNRRNWEARLQRAEAEMDKASRSLRLWQKAEDEMWLS
jgi:hypothetical protein